MSGPQRFPSALYSPVVALQAQTQDRQPWEKDTITGKKVHISTHTCNETTNLCVNRTLLQVVDYCVGNPGQMSHVSSSHTTRWSEHRSKTLKESHEQLSQKKINIYIYFYILKLFNYSFTGFYRSLPKPLVSSGQDGIAETTENPSYNQWTAFRASTTNGISTYWLQTSVDTLTWVTIRLYAEFSWLTGGWEGVSFEASSCETSWWDFRLSWAPKPGWSLISCAQGRRMAATQSSTWRCRKLFHVYLKNKSWSQGNTTLNMYLCLIVVLWTCSANQKQVHGI